MSKIVAIFRVANMTQTQYYQCMQDLKETGLEHPQGRMSHLASTGENGMVIVDTYDSQASLDRFGEGLIPILVKNGVNPAVPEVTVVENEVMPPEH